MELLTTIALAVTLTVPARTSANVSLAAEGRIVVATWSAATAKGETDIYASVSADGGTTFGAPVRVSSAAGTAKVNGEQAPRVTLAPAPAGPPRIVIVWLGAGRTGTALLSARSDDGGKTFGPSAIVPGSDAAGNRGWQAAAADNKGVVHALWLDHRGMAALGRLCGDAHAWRVRTGLRWRGDGPEVGAVYVGRGARGHSPVDHQWCLLLLQDGARLRPGWNLVRRVASGVSRRHPRHRVRRLERWGRHLLGPGQSQR